MPESQILKFHCRLLSPYHTTQHVYRNIVRCNPCILGSSIRGMLLSYLIQTGCNERYLTQLVEKKSIVEIQQFHRDCPQECVVKHLTGTMDWLPIFSFAHFLGGFDMGLLHRIAKDRERGTVAEGRIVSIEVVPEGTEFEFTVSLPGAAFQYRAQLEQAIRDVGKWLGIGHYKPLGLGRFEVASIECLQLVAEISKVYKQLAGMPKALRLGLETPLVIENGGRALPLARPALGQEVARLLAQRTAEIRGRFNIDELSATEPLGIEECRMAFRPDYFSRSSFEEGQRKNALVALPGSWLDVSFSEFSEPLREQLTIAQLVGIGPWADVGFGKLKIETMIRGVDG